MSSWRTLKTLARKITPPFELKPFNLLVTWKAIGIILLCTLLIVAVVYVKRDTIKDLATQPSHQTRNRQLVEKTQTADQIIFNLLGKLALPEDALSLQHLERHDELGDWNSSLITITIPPAISFPQVENAFTRGLAFFEEEDLTAQFLFDGDNCLNITIHIQERKTHHLVFCQTPIIPEQEVSTEESYRVAIVIDDLGENYGSFEELSSMNVPFTYSILPFQTHSIRIADAVNSRKGEVVLHLPLEPWNSSQHAINHGTLLTSMSEDQLHAQLERNINALPHLSGVSNHMGSKFTENQEKMKTVLQAVKEKGLYFLDSRTSDKTVGYALAKEMHIKTAQRNLFIDNDHNQLSAEQQLQKIPRLAKKNGGHLIAIGHPYRSTITALKKCVPLLQEQGITVVPLSQLLNENREAHPIP
jgi:polysaccharide deacetylase 2 family uncharacterized protein YibQ